MAEGANSTICGLPYWVPIPRNDTASFIHDVVVCAVNVPFCVFAFLGNLAVIVAVIKTPSLQRPCNILLCSLATTDCLTGLVAQPLFIAWRLMIHRIHESCDHQAELFYASDVCQAAFTGWSFVNITLLSFDHHYALAKPMVYRASVTKKDAILAVITTGPSWLILAAILVTVILPNFPAVVLGLVLGVILLILPIVNHIGIFTAIRRHNKQVADAVSGQNLSVIFKREKKAAIDMFIVIALLLLCQAPFIAVIMFSGAFTSNTFGVLYMWCVTLLYLNSAINPVLYLVRKSEIRSAVKSMICI